MSRERFSQVFQADILMNNIIYSDNVLEIVILIERKIYCEKLHCRIYLKEIFYDY